MAKQDRELRWVALRDMVLMRRGNRAVLNEKFVQEIGDTFDRSKLGVFHLGVPNGHTKYPVIDGQHRWSALNKKFPDMLVPCIIDKTATETKDQAEIFLGLQHRLAVKSIDKFIGAVMAGHPEEVAINKIVEKFGFRIGAATSEKVVAAVSSLTRIYSEMGEEGLLAVFTMVTEAWGHTANAVRGGILEGAAKFLKRHGESIDHSALIKKLRQWPGGVDDIIGKARASKDVHGSTISNNVASIFVSAYNKGRRGGALPNWWR